MKIVVLAGGMSMERNVSLSSGSRICRALRERGHQAVLVDMFLGLENHRGELCDIFESADGLCEEFSVAREEPDLEQVRRSRRDKGASLFGKDVLAVCAMADIVFIALHGTCGEDGRVQAAFDLLGIPYTGSGYLGSAIAMDKDLTKRLVSPYVMTPQWKKVRYSAEEIEKIAESTKLPCVVKPLANGSSVGVSIAHTYEEVCTALKECLSFGGEVVMEEYICGREIQCAVLEGKALPSIEIIPKTGFYDYANKYQPGAAEEVCPSQIPEAWEEKVRSATEKVFEILGLNVYSRADFIVTEDGTPYFLEINTLPGMTPTSLVPQEAAVVGIGYGELCERIIKQSLACRRGEKA